MKIKKWAAVAIVAGALVGSAGVAMAVTGWSVNGTAKASSTIGTVVPTTGQGSVIGAIFPGESNDCDITFTNPNAVPVTITAIQGAGYVVQSGPAAGQSAGTPTAPVATFPGGTINSVSGLNIVVPKNGNAEATISNCVTGGDIPQSAGGTQVELHWLTTGTTS